MRTLPASSARRSKSWARKARRHSASRSWRSGGRRKAAAATGRRWCGPAERAFRWSRKPAPESAVPTGRARSWPLPSRSTAGACAPPTSCRMPILCSAGAELSKCRSALRYQNRSGPEAPEVTEARHELSAISEAFHDAVSPDERARLGEERQQRWDWLHARRFPRAGQPSPQDLVRALQLVLLPGDAALYYYWLETDHLLIAALDGSRFVPVVRRLDPPSARTSRISPSTFSSSRTRAHNCGWTTWSIFRTCCSLQRFARFSRERGGCAVRPIACCMPFPSTPFLWTARP